MRSGYAGVHTHTSLNSSRGRAIPTAKRRARDEYEHARVLVFL